MSRTQYAPKQTYTGNGSVAAYTFAFKIEANTQLELIVMDDLGAEIERLRGDDTVYISSVDFDTVQGGGTVNLQANLDNNYKIILLLANDEPTQNFQFSNKLSFSLRRFEAALDWILGPVQRLSYLSKQALRIHDSEDEETFNTQLPPDIAGNIGNAIVVNDTADGFKYGTIGNPTINSNINVTGVSQGQYNNGDVIVAGTDLESILRNMLTIVIAPTLSLAGNGVFLVESGTMINPTLTPNFNQNDAGLPTNYELRKDTISIFTNPTPAPFGDPVFSIVDTTHVYECTVTYDGANFPAGSLVSNTVSYVGARAAFFQVGGDPVNIRTNSNTLINVQAGSNLVTIGDGASLTCIFAYPAVLGAPTSLFLANTGGNFDISSDLIAETNQSVNDASGGNAILYSVYSYTALIPIKVTDTLTLNI